MVEGRRIGKKIMGARFLTVKESTKKVKARMKSVLLN